MARVIWSPQARQDLRDIRQYIARDSRRYATIVADRIVMTVERLSIFPLSGRVVPEDQQAEYREIFLYDYRIIYHIIGEDVEVVTIFHGARQLADPSGS